MAQVWPGSYVFCPRCGARLVEAIRSGRSRPVCPDCDWIHFRNPGVGVAVLLRDETGRVLLVRRGPGVTRAGAWCIPCGYLEYGEEAREGAARELREETGLEAEIGPPVFVRTNFHDPAKVTVGIWFEGTVTGGEPSPGDDAVEVGWFPLDRLPELAFPTDEALLATLV